jgi:GNAT superfamily N-acetyltransferase
MDLKIGKTITATELQECEHIAQFGVYEIYLLNEDVTFLFAIDNVNLICSCFEFHETEEGMQLAHMYTLKNLQGQGVGKQILREAVSLWTVFKLPSIDTNRTYYFIEDGIGWTRHCFEIGILSQPPFNRP